MLGSIAGDIIGSVYEWDRIKTTDFPLFQDKCDYTDDSVLTIATTYAILSETSYAQSYKDFSRRYPERGYGGRFQGWIISDTLEPYNSWGNGSAMRVSPVGFAFESIEEVLEQSKMSAEVTHNHPEGIKGAQATALTIFLARKGNDKETIRKEVSQRFNYDLSRTVDEIRPNYYFNESCMETVPEAIIAFLDSEDYEHSIRLAVSLGGDSDTLACITGGIAEAYYKGVPEHIVNEVMKIIPDEFIEIIEHFRERYMDKKMKQKLKCLIGATPASESGFKKRMRFHQGWWRAFVLGENEGQHPLDIQKTVCNTILDGEQSKKNFLTDKTTQVVEQILQNRCGGSSGIIEEDRLFNNLLSSQPLCFNFFSELKSDKVFALDVMNNLGFNLSIVKDVIFEYAPSANYTNDNSAFDVALKVTREGKKGLIGLECKYTDTFSAKKYDRKEYQSIFERSNIFIEKYDDYKISKFNQLFRNQLIAEALKQNGEYDFVITGLFCHKDDAGIETGEQFQEMLNCKDKLFKVITYQDFISAIQQLDISWEQREFSMMLWARYCGTKLSDAVC